MYIHSHHKCATRWTIDYFEQVAKLNNATFEWIDHTDAMRPRPANICYFGNSVYETAALRKLFGLHIVRNPMSIIVSAYYSHLGTHPIAGWRRLENHRRVLQSTDLQTGLYLTQAFLERSDMAAHTAGPLHALRTWDYDDPRFRLIRMEDLVLAPGEVLRRIPAYAPLTLPDDADFAFERYADGRKVGETEPGSHYRSGRSDEWREVLPGPLIDHCRWTYAPLLERAYPEALG